jgi:hypothetical protein
MKKQEVEKWKIRQNLLFKLLKMLAPLPKNRCTIIISPGITVIYSLVSVNWSESLTQLGGNADFDWVLSIKRGEI